MNENQFRMHFEKNMPKEKYVNNSSLFDMEYIVCNTPLRNIPKGCNTLPNLHQNGLVLSFDYSILLVMIKCI